MVNSIKGIRLAPTADANNRGINKDYSKEKEHISVNANVKKALDHLIHSVKIYNNKIRFEYEENTEEMIVKVIDGETGKMIRQIPHEEIVKLSKNIDSSEGLLIDKEV